MIHTIETRFHRAGAMWVGQAKVIGPNGTRFVEVRVPLDEALAAMRAKGFDVKVSGEDLVGWFGSGIVKSLGKAAKGAVNVVAKPGKSVKALGHAVTHPGKSLEAVYKAADKIAKDKVVKKLGGAVKAVIKSNITKAAVAGLAVAFPPVGVPAAAAYATAAAVVAYADMADKYVGTAKDLVSAGKGLAKGNLGPAAKAGLAFAATGSAANAKLIGTAKGKEVLGDVAGKIRAGMQAKQVIAEAIKRHQAGDPKATKFLKTVAVVKRSNRKLNAIKSTLAAARQKPGIVVLPSGELYKGAFNTAGLTRL